MSLVISKSRKIQNTTFRERKRKLVNYYKCNYKEGGILGNLIHQKILKYLFYIRSGSKDISIKRFNIYTRCIVHQVNH